MHVMDYREQAYDEVMVRLGKAFKAEQHELVGRLNTAITVLEEIWPDVVEKSKCRHGVK